MKRRRSLWPLLLHTFSNVITSSASSTSPLLFGAATGRTPLVAFQGNLARSAFVLSTFSSLNRLAYAGKDDTTAPTCSESKRRASSISTPTRRFSTTSSSSMDPATSAASASSSAAVAWRERISLLTQDEARKIDEELMSTPGFSVDQLMELAGLSVAEAVDDFLQHKSRSSSVLLICGPGNNGGDGLVAARHLHHFGYQPMVVYPKRPAKALYENLVRQCEDLGIEVGYVLPEDIDGRYDVVVDAMFGFGSTGPLRAPFDQIIKTLVHIVAPIVSVDIPSGWDVEQGDIYQTGFAPEALVSLTAPKKCSSFFRGRHYLGGRFVPPKIRQQYKLKVPTYPGVSQFVEIEGWDDIEEEGPEAGRQERTRALSSSPEHVPASKATEFIVTWVTAPSMEEAQTLADGLVKEELAACVNILPSVESVYKWEGKVERGNEVLLMAKTRTSLLPEFSSYIKGHHSYEVPETIAASIVGGSAAYLKWLRESTREPSSSPSSGKTSREGEE